MSAQIHGRIGHCLAEQESLIECLARHFALARERSEWLIAFGGVYVDRLRVDSDRALTTGQYVRVHFDPRRYPADGIDWPATVVHHDEAFLVVNKPALIPVHATLDNRVENVLHQLSLALGIPLLVTQRLDIEVGGLMVLAKTREFQREFNRLLVEHQVKKRYRAIVSSPPPPGRHIHFMEPSKRSPRRVDATAHEGWLQCALSIVSVGPLDIAGSFEVEIDLETGRTHQIRTQLSALGSPILGDTMYGSQAPHNGPGIALFSVSLAWTGSDGRAWEFTQRPPWASTSVTI